MPKTRKNYRGGNNTKLAPISSQKLNFLLPNNVNIVRHNQQPRSITTPITLSDNALVYNIRNHPSYNYMNNTNYNNYTQNKIKDPFLTRTRKAFRGLPFFKQTPFTKKSSQINYSKGTLKRPYQSRYKTSNFRYNVKFNNSKTRTNYHEINNSNHLRPIPKAPGTLQRMNNNMSQNIPQNIQKAFAKNARVKANIISKYNELGPMIEELEEMRNYKTTKLSDELKELAKEYATKIGADVRDVINDTGIPAESKKDFLLEYRKQRILFDLNKYSTNKMNRKYGRWIFVKDE